MSLRLCEDLPSLRDPQIHRVVVEALKRVDERLGTRVLDYSIEHDELHLLVQAVSKKALSRGMQGLTIRLAKALNRACGRPSGRVFRDRYQVVA